MSVLPIKAIQGIYDTKNPTEQQKEEYERWADDGFVCIREDFALNFRKNVEEINYAILN